MNFIFLIKDLFAKSHILLELVKSDFKNRYLGSYLGMVWPFVNPIITIGIFLFVFQFGFKNPPVDNVPFVIWLCSGMIPWFYFSETFSAGSNAFIEYSFLIKKLSFRVSLIPLIKVFSNLIVHIFFIFLLLIILLLHGYTPNLFWLQYFYYLFCMVSLLIGLSWFSASIMIFIKDVGNLIGILIQFGFWLTPIFWNISFLPEKFRFYILLNPVTYIVLGFRDTFIYHHWFWENIPTFISFWIINTTILGLGLVVFKKTRPHFGDVL
ncbi:MAG: ABC transporter permease [Bacteriovoracaceae bacterium]